MFCAYCGSGTLETDRNCVKCGAPISSNVNKQFNVFETIVFSSHEELISKYNSLQSFGKTFFSEDDSLLVVNNCPNQLNLNTNHWGSYSGKRYAFKILEAKFVKVSDINLFLEYHRTFAENLYFLIMDKDYVRLMGLSGNYEKSLNEKVEIKWVSESTEIEEELPLPKE